MEEKILDLSLLSYQDTIKIISQKFGYKFANFLINSLKKELITLEKAEYISNFLKNLTYTTEIKLQDIQFLKNEQKNLLKEFFNYIVNKNNFVIKKYLTLEDVYLFFENMNLKNIDEIGNILLIPNTYKYKRKSNECENENKIEEPQEFKKDFKKERKNKPFYI